MFNLVVGILNVISLFTCIISVQSTASGRPKSGQGSGCIHILTAPSGIIMSPNYGPNQKYPSNLACKWTITAPLGNKIKLLFKDFVVETSRSCRSDYLLLYDGKNNNARLVGRYCVTMPAPFTSSSNYIHLEFHSDVSLEYRGFYATYNTLLLTTEKPTQWRSRPKFSSTILNKTAIVGDFVQLKCKVDGTPEPVIMWEKDSQNLTQDNNIAIKNSTFTSVLNIKKVSKNDEGKYSCKASNGFGQPIEAHGFLVVKDRQIPLITKTTRNQTVSVGKRIELICEADGLAPMQIMFSEKNKELNASRCDKRAGCQIQLTKMFVEDTVIACKVRNSVGADARDIFITVEGPPVIIHAPQNQTVQRGDAVNFTCMALGKNLKFSWLKDSEYIPDGVVTTHGRSVLSLSVEKNATLTCTVEGEDGITSSNARVLIAEEKKEPAAKTLKPTFSTVPSNKSVDYKESTKRPINSSTTITPVNTESVPEVGSGKMNDNIKLILGAGGGMLVLTGLIILFIVLRRKRNKKIEKNERRATDTTAREDENLIPNPTFNNMKDLEANKPGVETLHYPRENIEQTETLENGSHIEMFKGRATDLPFSPGEYDVVVRALKNDEPSEEIKDDFDLEASLLANLVHPNVVRLMAVCIKTAPLCLVFEYSNYGYLDEYLQECDSSEIKHTKKTKPPVVKDSCTELTNVDRLSIAKQIACGMKYLTSKGYVHQELRARNCLVFKDLQVKVANLGLHWAKPDQNFFVMDPEERQRFPVRWLPAEVVLYGEYTQSADVWSYGVLVWEIFSNGQQPYTGINDSDVVSYVRGCNILPRPKICPHEVYEVMKSCWEMAPLERPDFKSLEETITALHAGVPV